MLRLASLILVLAAPASAGPFIRWLDKTGGVRREEVEKVVAESVTAVEVVVEGGKKLQVPGTQLLHLVRERTTDSDERALLRARRAADAGDEIELSRRALERVAANGREDWMREYATIWRAVLSERAGEEGAADRIDKALKAYPDSRFVGDLILSRARLLSAAGKDLQERQGPFVDAFKAIGEKGGPRVVQFRAFVFAARRMSETNDTEWNVFLAATAQGLKEAQKENENDLVVYTAAESAHRWMLLERARHQRLEQVAIGVKPHGALGIVRKLKEETQLLLPELRSDVRCELGWILAACEDPDGARIEFEAALKDATDLWRRRRAREGLKTLPKPKDAEKK